MKFSINSVKRNADNPEEIVITEEALGVLGHILEEQGVEILEKAIEIAENKNNPAVNGDEIREAVF